MLQSLLIIRVLFGI